MPNAKEAPVRRLTYEHFLEYRRKKTVARLRDEWVLTLVDRP